MDGLDVLKDSNSGIYYTAKEWRQLTTEDSSVSLAGYHGRRTTATRAIKRVITLEWLIQRAENSNEVESVTYLQNMFNLQSETGILVLRILYIKDIYDKEWNLSVKVREPIRFIEYDQNWKGYSWKWSVTLESVWDPTYKSTTELLSTGQEGNAGGFYLPTTFPIAFSPVINPIQCVTYGNTATPAKIVITCSDNITAPLRVMNITNGTFFALNISATAGQVIIIDSNTKTATKDGVSVIASRVSGSTFPTISGTTQFIVSDAGWYTLDHFTVAIYYKDALLA